MPQADVLIVNGHVFTADPQQPQAAAVALRGRRITWVGAAAAADVWRGPDTRVIDAAGGTVMPGFIDSHFHLLLGALELDALQLDAVDDLDGLAAALRDWAATQPDAPWLVGAQLRYSAIPPGRSLDRHFLDGIVADRPVFLSAYDTHTVWANTRALELGGRLHGGPVPAGSAIVMASDGTASGELREPGAYNALRDLIPKPDAAQTRALLRQALDRCARLGITSVHNMDGDQAQIDLYAALEAEGTLSVRVYVPYSVTPETPLAALQEAATWRDRYRGSHVRGGSIKLFMDGVLESYTGYLVDAYAGRPGDVGSALFTAEHFNVLAAEADRLGLQIKVHACGDGAVRRALDGFAHAQAVNGVRDSRHRIEHIELVHPEDIARFRDLGVIASMQPLHAPVAVDGLDVWPDRVGPSRWRHSFAWQTLRDAGARLAFGSDWPVAPMDPMLGVWAGVCRRPWQAGDPVQAQTLGDLLLGYTHDAAFAEFQEQQKGMLRPGLLADLVVLDADLFSTAPEDLPKLRPVLTMVDGVIVYRDGL